MTSRKGFIAAGSLFALTGALADAASPIAHTASAAAHPALRFSFDRARFDAILAKPARHKQCFGATKIAAGDVLEGMNNSIRAYREYMDEGPGSLQPVAVLYHGAAIAMGLSDTVWNRLLIPSLPKAPSQIRAQFGAVKAGAGNPYLRSAGSDPDDVSVERLVGKGAAFFICHNALVGFSDLVASALRIPLAAVHAQLLQGVVPGALAVPAGVMAINACQEAKFTYIQSS